MNEGMVAPAQTLADDLLHGGRAYSEFTGLPLRRCFYLLERGLLPGSKFGERWVGSKRAVREKLEAAMNKNAT